MNQDFNEQQQRNEEEGRHNANTDIEEVDTSNSFPSPPTNTNASINTTSSIDDDAITEINITSSPTSSNLNDPQTNNRLWTDSERELYEERRREALNQELNRVQRTNFIHFMILCFIPILLIGMVLANSFGESGECIGFANLVCRRDKRHFMNGYSSGCICDAFNTTVMVDIGGEE